MLQMLPRLFQPPELIIKRGSLIRLQFLKGKKASLIIGKDFFRRSGNLTKVENYLKKANLELSIIDGISGDPTIESVESLTEKLLSQNPDWIIAIGGGAVLDSAKLARILYENPKLSISDIEKPFSAPSPQKSKLILIPTTSGTGSEVSQVAVVIDKEKGMKLPIISEGFIPDLAILDATLTLQLPPEKTVYTALDAFSHAIEAYCSRAGNLLTYSYAVMAGRLIVQNLVPVITNARNINARESLQYGAMFGGMAQNMASVGAIHAISHSIGAKIDIPHGYANAILLPAVIELNSKNSPLPSQFAEEIGFTHLDEMLEWLNKLMESVGLSKKWPEEFDVEEVAEASLKDTCMRTNSVKIEKNDILKILEDLK